MSRVTVSDVGEDALIDLIRRRLPGPPAEETWSGDDAAVLRLEGEVVVTTDCLVEAVDFSFAYASGADAAWKAMASNVSDVAAMGCVPTHALAVVGLARATPLDVFESMVEGLTGAAQRFDAALVGGDISEARDVFVTVTMIGAGSRKVLRSGAGPGDAICVTGELGGARGGLIVLRQGHTTAGPFEGLVSRQLRPAPSTEAGRAAAEAGATSMIDVSDGLAIDLHRLMAASGTGCRVDEAAIPVDPALDVLVATVDGLDALTLALLGGEDFELLFTIPANRVDAVRARSDRRVTVIGTVTDGERVVGDRLLTEWKERAWEHLRDR